ncbi:MAG: lamin tail domain-containing protein, partial [Leptospiraceae bacterium]|nr:lamin tail domain-containing protein [Leptospiraceae bacterium]
GNAQTGDEFIELYNRSGNAINISGWQIEGAASGGGSLVLPLCATIPAGGVYTIGKYNDRAFTNLNYITPSLSLSNSGRNLVLKDASGTVIHSLTGCTSSWGSKGQNGGANAPKRSMRLDTVLKTLPYTSSACTASDWTTTSTGDSNYGTSSANVRSAYKANDDTSDGTVATPGYAGP